MKSDIFDKNKKEVKKGDIVQFPYITPKGEITDVLDFEKKIVFKFGCFGFFTQTKFIPLMDCMETKQGEYIPNCGNKTIYTEIYPFIIKQK